MNEKPKSVKLEEDTRIKLNKAKSIFLSNNPKARTTSDNLIINVALAKYIETNGGKTK